MQVFQVPLPFYTAKQLQLQLSNSMISSNQETGLEFWSIVESLYPLSILEFLLDLTIMLPKIVAESEI